VRRNRTSLNYWPAVADFMLALFIIALVLGVLTSVVALLQSVGGFGRGDDKPNPSVPISEYEKIRQERDKLLPEVQELRKRVGINGEDATITITASVYSTLTNQVAAATQKPPVIVIREKRGMHFASGSAVPNQAFVDSLIGDVLPEILDELNKFRGRVDTMVIVGHTDSKPLNGSGNLDQQLQPMLNRQTDTSHLRAGSNADLGLMRAAAVRNILKPLLEQYGWSDFPIRCLSAANGLPPEKTDKDPENEKDPDARCRRIEVMFMGLKSQ
jgi:hypothetical protein